MVVCNRIGDVLQQDCLTGLGLSHDKAALTLADRGEHIHDAYRDVAVVTVAGEVELLVGEKRGEEIERDTVADEFRTAAVDGVDAHQREILVAFARRTDVTEDGVARLEGIVLYLRLGYIDIVGRIEIVVVRRAEEAVAVRHHLEHAAGLHHAVVFYAGALGLLILLVLLVLLPVIILVLSLLRLSLLLVTLLGLLALGLLTLRLRLRLLASLLGLLGCGRSCWLLFSRLCGPLAHAGTRLTFGLFRLRLCLLRCLCGDCSGFFCLSCLGRTADALASGFLLCRLGLGCGFCHCGSSCCCALCLGFTATLLGRRSLGVGLLRRLGRRLGLGHAGPFYRFAALNSLLVQNNIHKVLLRYGFGLFDFKLFGNLYQLFPTLAIEFYYVVHIKFMMIKRRTERIVLLLRCANVIRKGVKTNLSCDNFPLHLHFQVECRSRRSRRKIIPSGGVNDTS